MLQNFSLGEIGDCCAGDGCRLYIVKAIPAHKWRFMSEKQIRFNFNDWDYNQFTGFKDVIEVTATFEPKVCRSQSTKNLLDKALDFTKKVQLTPKMNTVPHGVGTAFLSLSAIKGQFQH